MEKLEIFENSKNYTCQIVRIKHIRKHSKQLDSGSSDIEEQGVK